MSDGGVVFLGQIADMCARQGLGRPVPEDVDNLQGSIWLGSTDFHTIFMVVEGACRGQVWTLDDRDGTKTGLTLQRMGAWSAAKRAVCGLQSDLVATLCILALAPAWPWPAMTAEE
jgi:hypothetical protein